MVIRTFHKQRNFKRNIIILTFMLLGILIVAKISNFVFLKIKEQGLPSSIQVGNSISFAGKITSDSNFPIYTHKITNSDGGYMFLRSSVINLNKYSGDIEIYGEIKDIRKDTPVIETTAIKFPEQGLMVKENTYLFVKDMLYLDFSNQPMLSAKKDGKEIKIFYGNEKIASIERFLCSRVLRQKDCSYLIEDYGTSQKENFDSYRGYTYYKHGSGLRTVFDGKMFGYIFKGIEQDTMLNLSNIVRIVDKNFIISNKKDIIQEACSGKDQPIEQIGSASVQYEDDNKVSILVDIPGKDKGCKVTFDMRNGRNITKTSIVSK